MKHPNILTQTQQKQKDLLKQNVFNIINIIKKDTAESQKQSKHNI